MIRKSFRDPKGRTWQATGRIIRASWGDSPKPEFGALLVLIQSLQAEGKWIFAKEVAPEAVLPFLDSGVPLPQTVWEHPRVFFPSYAHEWSPGMLHCAAELTLDLNERFLGLDWELQDATHSNVLFDGPHPIFVDHLSPSRRMAGQMGWVAYGQFIRNFLIPLCLHYLNSVPLSWLFLARRDGLPPEDAVTQLSWFNRLRPSVLGLITLPAWLAGHQGRKPVGGMSIRRDDTEHVGMVITKYLLRGLAKRLQRWAPRPVQVSHWSRYDQAEESYTAEGRLAKDSFVCEALYNCKPSAVLDLGCNQGRYSKLAAKAGGRVVAVDGDPACIDNLWRQVRHEGLDVLPLVIDLGRPSPALGWENGEEIPFLERVEGRFDMVMALALVHHLLVRERVPLSWVLAFLARQTTNWVILEWVPPDDPQFERMAGPNRALYQALTRTQFEGALDGVFLIDRCLEIPGGHRILYLLSKITEQPPKNGAL